MTTVCMMGKIPDEGVQLAPRHHVAEVPIGGHGLSADVGRQGHVHLLHARPLAALEPVHVPGRHPVLVLEDAADPHRGRHVVLGHPHALAGQIAGLADAGVVAHENRRVAEAERGKDGDGHRRLAAAPEHGVGGEGGLRGVELANLAMR
jgi:hypothetical protein